MADTDPAPVVVANPDPIAVTMGNPDPAPAKAAASARVDAEILRTEDQRRISGIWERTQQIIALAVVFSVLGVAIVKSIIAALNDQDSTEAGVAFVFLASVANLVIGFYFGRTNHTRVGGQGPNER